MGAGLEAGLGAGALPGACLVHAWDLQCPLPRQAGLGAEEDRLWRCRVVMDRDGANILQGCNVHIKGVVIACARQHAVADGDQVLCGSMFR